MFIDMIDVMQWLGITMLAVVVYVMAFNTKSSRSGGPYSVPNWNFAVKKLWAERLLRKKSKNDAQKTIDFQYLKREQLSSANDLHSSTLIYGNDVVGNSLLISLQKGKDLATELTLVLRLADGQVFTMPSIVTATLLPWNVNVAERCEINGLSFECLRPYRKWRITYAGLLTTRKSGSDTVDEQQQFVKFNFFWTYAGIPQHWPADWSSSLQASALAAEPWRHAYWLEYLQTSDYGGFDQFGSLFGQVTLCPGGVSKTLELNLPGVRQRRWTSYEVEKIKSSCTIVGICPDGTLYILGAHSLDRNLTNAQFGYVRTANGTVTPIDWTDFHLSEFAQNRKTDLNPISIRFSANGIMFTSTVYANPSERIPVFGSIPRCWVGDVSGAQIGVNGEHGQGIVLQTRVPKSIKPNRGPKPSSAAVLKYSDHRPTRTKLAHWFTDAAAQSEHISGGKGASLALLTSAMSSSHTNPAVHYTVPSGFVLSASAFDLQLSMHPSILDDIERLEKIAYGHISDDLEANCANVSESITGCPLVPEVEQSIAKFYHDLRAASPDLRLAVRSSAIGEDSEDASSAGQNETFLGLSSVDDVWTAVRRCWASLYSYRSVEYRRQHLQPILAQMAVVVQTMVPSDCAGVLFTRHPSSGDPSKTLISANYGLGESVVSGAVDPDTFVVSRETKDGELRILETHLGTKAHAIHMTSQRGGNSQNVSQINLSQNEQQKACLSAEQVLRLAKVGVYLERLYGNSRDIEWAFYQDQVYLLQSRPITTLNSMSNWELLHEMDSAVMSKHELLSFANVGEVLPECTTPLTISTVVASLRRCTARTLEHKTSSPYSGMFDGYFCTTHHRVALDIIPLFLSFREKEISITDKVQSIAVCGHVFLTPEIHRISLHRYGVMRGHQKAALMWDVAKCVWNNKASVQKLERFIDGYTNRFSEDNLTEFKDHDVEQFNAEINFEIDDPDRFDEASMIHMGSSKVSTFSQIIAFTMLAESNLELSAEHFADMGLLLGSCNDIESAEVPTMLEEISNTIYLAGLSDVFVEIPKEEGAEWLNQNCTKAGYLFRNFIKRHGHRSVKEFELGTKTWGMQPELIVEMIQATCRHAKNVLAAKTRKRVLSDAEIIAQLQTPTKNSTRKTLGYVLPLCKTSVRRREATKSGIIAYIHELRKAYIHLADLLYREGLLPDRQLIFYLERDELSDLIAKPTVEMAVNKSKLVAKAQRRMRSFPQWNALKFNEFNSGVLHPIDTDDEVDVQGRTTVCGTSVNEGSVTGRACVITSFSDIGRIQSGDILVTLSTDIGWSTYFPILGGVVTELGGLISHGAVVAREYGLPCMVGATGATRIVRHGDRVTLDATKGVLIIVQDDKHDD